MPLTAIESSDGFYRKAAQVQSRYGHACMHACMHARCPASSVVEVLYYIISVLNRDDRSTADRLSAVEALSHPFMYVFAPSDADAVSFALC